jgi:hypothetical protein
MAAEIDVGGRTSTGYGSKLDWGRKGPYGFEWIHV